MMTQNLHQKEAYFKGRFGFGVCMNFPPLESQLLSLRMQARLAMLTG